MKIRTRVFLSFLIIVAGAFYFLTRWVIDDLRPRYLESAEEPLVDISHVLAALVADQAAEGGIDPSDLKAAFNEAYKRTFTAQIYGLRKRHVDLRVYVTDARGKVVFDSEEGRDEGEDYSRWNDVWLTLQGRYGVRTTRSDPTDPSTATMCVAAPVVLNGRTVGVLSVCKPTSNIHQFVTAAKWKIVLAGSIAAGIAIVLGILVTGWVTRPLQKLTRYAQAARDGRRVALPDLGRSEIGVMGRALEEMRQALEGKKYVEQYVQTLTHEIKGPLAAIHGASELLQEEMPADQRARFLANIERETARIQRIVDRMLELASIESRTSLQKVEAIDLAALIAEIVESVRPQHVARNVSLANHAREPVTIRGERFLVRQSIANLLQNAIDFSPDGGACAVAVARTDTHVEIAVTDSGPGVPDYALDRVFDKFYSLPRPGTGVKSSGLGLAFVREAAALHGGTVHLANRPEGGAEATLRLPSTPPAETV